ncbi:hypothetical protein CYJ96_00430 [Moraxella osloensis]|uniref:Uncharacterized protein n=1 Tax=Faucicola osloensis TaxID=34062 RepID=A0A2I1RL60_FAUOS|nr:hypothetical protein [Moraxella osloensis]PKZ69858.1 hypothetical protein CYJ96_00430 [Moraxella osloensis]
MMFTKRFFRPDCLPVVAIAICSAVALSGCQSMTKQPSARAKHPLVTAPQPIAAGKSTLKCTGVYACEINRIGTLSVINQSTHTPSATLGNHSQVASPVTVTPLMSKPQSKSSMPNYLVSFPSGQHMVASRFYLDEGLTTAESFSFIHRFESGKRYALKAYRQIQKTDYSLLAQSAPTPLCIDLYENAKLTNRWCKKPNQQGALSNEFIKIAL